MKKFFFLVVLTITGFLSLQAQESMTVNIAPGELNSKLTKDQKTLVTSLTLTGSMDARDFKVIRDSLISLQTLDMKAVTIAAFTGKGGTDQNQIADVTYPANTIPSLGLSPRTATAGYPTVIVLPDNLEAIADGAFGGAKVTTLSFPATLKKVGEYVFAGSYLQKISFPEGVTLGEGDFNNCKSLEEVTLPADLKTIPKMLFANNTALGSITLPEGIDTIGIEAFEYSGLNTVTIPKNVTSIGYCAFTGCGNLLAVTFESGIRLQTLGSGAFSGTGLTTINFPAGVSALPDQILNGCKSLTSVTTTDPITAIGQYAFANTTVLGTLDANITEKVTDLGQAAFQNSGITGILKFPALKTIDTFYTFDNTPKLTGVELPDNVQATTNGYPNAFGTTFRNSGIVTFKVPATVTAFTNLFQGAASLQSVEIPAGITYIANASFQDATSLKTFINHVEDGSTITLEANIFNFVDLSKATLYVPDAAAVAQYATLPIWKDFGSIKVIGSTTGINDVYTTLPLRVVNGNVIVSTKQGSTVEVFTALGKKLYSQTADSDEATISGLPKGQVLIVRSGNAVAKVIL